MDTIRNIVKRLRESKLTEERTNYSELDRSELIAKAQSGDQLAVETLINTHQDFLGKMSNKYIIGNADKDDILQLATIAFWDAIQKYDPKTNGDFEAFAGMIIKRKLTDELRKDSAEKRKINNIAQSLDEPTADDGEGGESTVGDTLSTGVSAEEEYLGKEGARNLIRFMENNLSETERTVIKKYIAGYKVSQISEELDMKYKTVENAIMRVKNKLAEFMRNSFEESKKLKEAGEIEFSDEEKQILKSVLSKIDEKKSISESKLMKLKEAYENYTEVQLDKELESIESAIDDIAEEIKFVHPTQDYYDDLMYDLEELRDKLYGMEEYLTQEQYEKSQELLGKIAKAPDVEYEGDIKIDPYEYNGVSRSDFYPSNR